MRWKHPSNRSKQFLRSLSLFITILDLNLVSVVFCVVSYYKKQSWKDLFRVQDLGRCDVAGFYFPHEQVYAAKQTDWCITSGWLSKNFRNDTEYIDEQLMRFLLWFQIRIFGPFRSVVINKTHKALLLICYKDFSFKVGYYFDCKEPIWWSVSL